PEPVDEPRAAAHAEPVGHTDPVASGAEDRACAVCGFVAKTPGGLAAHARTHVRDRTCPACGFVAKTAGGLSAHRRVHA
ncbi:MAG: hypothetical protein M3N52_10205, partial [Actinomycetota bacterium]|nr:hypothetical protein [Actinomycetota bacterium]